MTGTPMDTEALEVWWEALAHAVDRAGPEHETMFLAKLALLLGRETGDLELCQRLMEQALEDLT